MAAKSTCIPIGSTAAKVNFFLYESIEFTGDSYGRRRPAHRLQLGWRQVLRKSLCIGRNITDELAILSGIDFNNLTGMINEPRTVRY